MLVLPVVAYGYTGHVMDFPGDHQHRITSTSSNQVLDITKSLAYHGFKKIILLNGHGSNWPNLDLAARRTNLETDAECIPVCWWNLLTVDKEFLPRWRQSKFPGGCSHACELETSLYLYLDGDNVRKDQIKSGTISFNDEESPFNWVDLFGAGPATLISWTSSYSETGVLGDAELATAEKGREAYEEAVKQLVRLVTLVQGPPQGPAPRPPPPPADHADPWGQGPCEVDSRDGPTGRIRLLETATEIKLNGSASGSFAYRDAAKLSLPPVADDAPKCLEGILQTDLLAFLVGAAGVADRHFVDPPRRLALALPGDLRGHLRFGFEPEVTAKIARKRKGQPPWRIYEVPISYSGRTYEEGKKIGLKDAFQALWCIVRYWWKD